MISTHAGAADRASCVRKTFPNAPPVTSVADDEPEPLAIVAMVSAIVPWVVPVVRSAEIGDQLPPDALVPAGRPPLVERQTRFVPP